MLRKDEIKHLASMRDVVLGANGENKLAENISNEEILNKVGEKRSLVNTTQRC